MLDVLLSPVLFLAALALRLPNLILVPTFTSEAGEVLQGMLILNGKLLLLTNVDPYYGSLFNYLIAATFVVFGPSAEHARLMVTVLGALTVPLTYFFASTLEDRLTGVLAALMMLTSATLILNGHVAWENNLTPFFATATLLALTLALKRGNGKLLAASGFLYGLTLQTHPGLIVLAPGLILYFAFSGLFARSPASRNSLKWWLKSPWLYVMLACVLLGYSNVISRNVVRPGISWTVAQQHDYAFESNPAPDSYLTSVQNLGLMQIRMISGAFAVRPAPLDYVLDPASLMYLGLLVAGVGYALRRGQLLPVILLVVTAVVLPYFNKRYVFPNSTRYAGYLFPLLYLLMAMPLARATRSSSRTLKLQPILVMLIACFIIIWPTVGLATYYHDSETAGNTNGALLSLHRTMRNEYQSGSIAEVLLDNTLDQARLNESGNVLMALDYLFTLDGTPHRTMDVRNVDIATVVTSTSGKTSALVLSSANYDTLAASVRLHAIRFETSSANLNYAAYVIDPSVNFAP